MTDTTYESLFIAYLALTILIELPVLVVTVRHVFSLPEDAVPLRFLLIGGIGASLLTYPYLWFLLPAFLPDYTMRHLVGETGIIIVEGILLFGVLRVSLRRALAASLLCNGTSIALGLLFNWLVRTQHWFR